MARNEASSSFMIMKYEKSWSQNLDSWSPSWYLTYLLDKLIFFSYKQPGMKCRKRGIDVAMPIIVFYLHLLLKFSPQPELFCIKQVKPEVVFTLTPDIDMTKSQTGMRLRFFSIIQVKESFGWTIKQWVVSISIEKSYKKWLSYWVRFKDIKLILKYRMLYLCVCGFFCMRSLVYACGLSRFSCV